MPLTATTPNMPITIYHNNVTFYLPEPTASQLLQRRIEDTLMLVSLLPESKEKVIVDLGAGERDSWFEIQCNQLALFMQLEELVERLSSEAKKNLIGNLHPAMSVQERNALKLALERGLRRNVVPRPLEVRKVVAVGDEGKEGGGESDEGRRKSFTVPPALRVEELVSPSKPVEESIFPELQADEIETRERELRAARAEQVGELVWPSSKANTMTAESKRRRQEIASMFASAAKKLQVTEASSGLGSPIVSPTLKEGLHLIKTATSAFRAYTDATPREVVVKPKGLDDRRSPALPRASQHSRPSPPNPVIQTPRHGDQDTTATSLQSPFAEPSARWRLTSAPPTAEPEVPSTSSLATSLQNPFAGPSAQWRLTSALQADETEPPRQSPGTTPPSPSLTAEPEPLTPSSSAAPPSIVQSEDSASMTRPQSDPSALYIPPSSNDGCPWPESFFTAPRTAPEAPRSVSLPHPAKRTDNPTVPPRLSAAPSTWTHKAKQLPPLPVLSIPQSTSENIPQSLPHPNLPPPSLPPLSSPPPPPSASHKRQGSIAAAKAGIAERQHRERLRAVGSTLPFVRSRVGEKWKRGEDGPERAKGK